MFIIILYAAGALAILTLYIALLISLTGIYAAKQAPEYAGKLMHWLGYGEKK